MVISVAIIATGLALIALACRREAVTIATERVQRDRIVRDLRGVGIVRRNAR